MWLSAGGGVQEVGNKELDALKKQSDEIAEILSGGKDTVEISDAARALSEAAKNTPPAEPEASESPESTVATDKTPAPVGAREERNATAADYNAVLEELRNQYDEDEAMRRFDAFMESEGFERVTEENRRDNGVDASGGISGMLRVFTGAVGSLSSGNMPHIERDSPFTSNLNSSSTIIGALVDGEVRYLAETHASYGANANEEIIDALSGLYRKNLESAQSGTSIDLDAYMKNNFGSNPQTSVVSASTNLVAVAANLLDAAGIDLGEDGKVSFSLKEDGSGLTISGAFEDGEAVQAAIDAALKKKPDMLQAFKDEYNRVALTDASNLDGAYNDGARSVEYGTAKRSFTYSAQEPSAVVMTDYIGVNVTGYNYQKKVSDSFTTDADFHSMSDGGVRFTYNNGQASIDPEAFEENQTINRQMNEDIRRAIETGEEISSTMTRSEYDAIQAERSGGVADPAAGLAAQAKLYSAVPDAEQEARAAEARQALLDLEADPRMREREIPYVDDRQEVRKATVSQLLELFAPGRAAPGPDMINSIMDFFRMRFTR